MSAHQGEWLKRRVQEAMSISAFCRRAGVSRTQAYEWFAQERLGMRTDLAWAVLDALGLSQTAEAHGHVRSNTSSDQLTELSYASSLFDNLIDQWGARGAVRTPPPGASIEIPENDLPIAQDRIERVVVRRIPFFDVALPAGGWIESGGAMTSEHASGHELVDDATPEDAFALRIEGDCMEPDFPGGSVIVFAPVRPGVPFAPGKPYYFEHSDGKATFKLVYYEPPRERYRLECLNRKYAKTYVPEQMLARLSRAIRVVRNLD